MQMYELIAPYYDLEHAGYEEDIDLYLNYAAIWLQKEVMCGRGL